jgi:hypothetical protein
LVRDIMHFDAMGLVLAVVRIGRAGRAVTFTERGVFLTSTAPISGIGVDRSRVVREITLPTVEYIGPVRSVRPLGGSGVRTTRIVRNTFFMH